MYRNLKNVGPLPISENLTLTNGIQMPIIGLGTWQSRPGEIDLAVKSALEVGYRLIDTAYVYGNEKEIGEALKKIFDCGSIKREDVFITTKLHMQYMHKEDVEPMLRKQLSLLQMDYVDLYLCHGPCSIKKVAYKLFPMDENGLCLPDQVDHMETWQLECHAYWPQNELCQLCRNLNIAVTAYGPIGSPGKRQNAAFQKEGDKPRPILLEDQTVKNIAAKYNKTPAQILLRWLIQRGINVIPKSINPIRIKENFDIFDFYLAIEDFQQLSNLTIRERLFSVDMFRNHPYYTNDFY